MLANLIFVSRTWSPGKNTMHSGVGDKIQFSLHKHREWYSWLNCEGRMSMRWQGVLHSTHSVLWSEG